MWGYAYDFRSYCEKVTVWCKGQLCTVLIKCCMFSNPVLCVWGADFTTGNLDFDSGQ